MSSSATPSTVFYDLEISGSLEPAFNFPDAAIIEDRMTRSTTTAPIAIPGGRGTCMRLQRHTNFTPPRSYIGSMEKHMARSKSAGSLSTAVSFLVTEQIHPKEPQSQGMSQTTECIVCEVFG